MPLFALDMDGTCLNDAGQLAPHTLKALAQARGAGWRICFVTGRTGVDMASFEYDREVADYLLLNSGGKLVESPTGKVLWNRCVPEPDARALVAHCAQSGWPLYCIAGAEVWLNIVSQSAADYLAAMGVTPRCFTSAAQVPCHRIEAFMATTHAEQVIEYMARAGLDTSWAWSEPGCIDITAGGVTKESGLAALLAQLGMDAADLVAMGNYDNDIGMLKMAKVGVAVKNAPAKVRAAADHVTTADNNGPAVPEVVERFILGNR
ncbi:HAD-IIB family hydrolase [Ruminococcaceae bacterium OttesenSCG-928-D13]|nr:HAD-IIB family hydrolase [Ruminococcaceae bacterium OttesenSCG-928-D13]